MNDAQLRFIVTMRDNTSAALNSVRGGLGQLTTTTKTARGTLTNFGNVFTTLSQKSRLAESSVFSFGKRSAEQMAAIKAKTDAYTSSTNKSRDAQFKWSATIFESTKRTSYFNNELDKTNRALDMASKRKPDFQWSKTLYSSTKTYSLKDASGGMNLGTTAALAAAIERLKDVLPKKGQMEEGLTIPPETVASMVTTNVAMNKLNETSNALKRGAANIWEMIFPSASTIAAKGVANDISQASAALELAGGLAKRVDFAPMKDGLLSLGVLMGTTFGSKFTKPLADVEEELLGSAVGFGVLHEAMQKLRTTAQGDTLDALNRMTGGLIGTRKAAEGAKDLFHQLLEQLNPMGYMIRQVAIALAGFAAFTTLVTAVQEARAFNQVLAETITLSDQSASNMGVYREKIIALSNDTGKAAREVAEAFRYITSSGEYNSETYLDVLQRSTEASVIGMGRVNDVANLTTSVLNAYGTSAGNAAEILGTMTVAIQEGKGEADKYATSMGLVLGIAAKAQVSFKDLSAAIATLTKTGLTPSEAVTGIRQMIMNLTTPTIQGRKVLEAYNLTWDHFKKMVKDRGLLATLNEIQKTMGLLDQSRLLGGDEGLNAMQSLTNPNLGAAGTFANVQAAGAGNLDKAFQLMKDTDVQKITDALNVFKNVALQIGEMILPPLAAILASVADNLDVLAFALGLVMAKFIGAESILIASKIVFGFGEAIKNAGKIIFLVVTQWGPLFKLAQGFIVRWSLAGALAIRTMAAAFMANPIGALLTALGWALSFLVGHMIGILPTIAMFPDAMFKWGESTYKASVIIQAVWDTLVGYTKAVVDTLIGFWKKHEKEISHWFHAGEQAAFDFARYLYNTVNTIIKTVALWIAYIQATPALMRGVFDLWVSYVQDMAGNIARLFMAIPGMEDAISFVSGLLATAGEFIENIWAVVLAVFNLARKKVQEFWASLQPAINSAMKGLKGFIDFIKQIPAVVAFVFAAITASIGDIGTGLIRLITRLPAIIKAAFTGNFKEAGKLVTDSFTFDMTAAVAKIPDTVNKATAAVAKNIDFDKSEAAAKKLKDTLAGIGAAGNAPTVLDTFAADVKKRADELSKAQTIVDPNKDKKLGNGAPPENLNPNRLTEEEGSEAAEKFSRRLAKEIGQINARTAALSQDQQTAALWASAGQLGINMMDQANLSLEQQNALKQLNIALSAEKTAQDKNELRSIGLEIEAQNMKYAALGLTGKARERELALLDARLKLAQDNRAEDLLTYQLTDDQIKAISAKADAMYDFENRVVTVREGLASLFDSMQDHVRNVGGQIADIMSQVTDDLTNTFTDFFMGQKLAWADFARSVISMILKMIVQLLIMKAVMASLNFFGIGSSSIDPSSINVIPNAKGNVIPFAKGGTFANSVVNSPTLFKFANGGKIGVMGEAGPEGILPLKRMSNGALGVQADGSGGGATFAPQITINVQGSGNGENDAATARRISDAVDAALQVKMQEFFMQQQRSGGRLVKYGR